MLFLLVEGIKKNLLKRSFATEHAFRSKNVLAFFSVVLFNFIASGAQNKNNI